MGIIFLLIIIILLIGFFTLIFSVLSIAPWLPAKSKDLERINRLANLQPQQSFYELGCGDGRVCLYLAKHNPQAKIIGIEISLLFFCLAKFRASLSGHKNLKIIFGNALKKDLSQADVVYVFGVRRSMNQLLKDKFSKELKGKVLSYVFKINDWPGKVIEDKPSKESVSIFIYEL